MGAGDGAEAAAPEATADGGGAAGTQKLGSKQALSPGKKAARRAALETAIVALMGDSAINAPCTADDDLRCAELPEDADFDLLDFKGQYVRNAPQQQGPPTIKIPVSALEELLKGEAKRSGQAELTKTHSSALRCTYACACCRPHAPPPAAAKPAVLEELEGLDPKSKRKLPARRGKASTRASIKGDCTMRFTVTRVDPDESGEAQNVIVRVLGLEHTGHSTVCISHHLAAWCIEYMRDEYYAGARAPSPKDLVLEVRAEAMRRGLAAARVAEPNLSADILRARWLRAEPGEFVREYGITRKQARDIIRAWEREDFELMPEEEDSLEAYAEADPENVFMYRPGGVCDADGVEDAFAFGWTTPWARERAVQYGHLQSFCVDATHSTNKWKYVLHTIVVVNHPWGKHVPVAWLLSKYEDHAPVRDWMDRFGLLLGAAPGEAPVQFAPYEAGGGSRAVGALTKEHLAALRRFCPSHIVIDVSATEVLAITQCMWGRGITGPGGTYVVGVGLVPEELIPRARIVYCDWHVKKAWAGQAKERGVSGDDVDLVMEGLAALVKLPVAAEAAGKVKKFCDAWRGIYPDFVSYFETYYANEASYVRWIRACYLDGYEGEAARIPTTNGAIECYHGLLKTDELSGRSRLCARRLDWLYKTILDMMIDRYEIEEMQLLAGLKPARKSYTTKLSAATPTVLTATEPSPYMPTADAARTAVTLDAMLASQAVLIERCKGAGVADTDVAYLIRNGNTALEKCAAAAERRAAPRAPRRARLQLNEEAVGGASKERVVRGDPRLKKRKAAGAAAPTAKAKAARFTKPPKTDGERKKRHKKKSMVRKWRAWGTEAKPSAAAAAAAIAAAS